MRLRFQGLLVQLVVQLVPCDLRGTLEGDGLAGAVLLLLVLVRRGSVSSVGSQLAGSLLTSGGAMPDRAWNVSMHAGWPAAIVPPGPSFPGSVAL